MRRLSTLLPALPFMAGALASALTLTSDSVWAAIAGVALLVIAGLFSLSAPGRGLIFTSVGTIVAAISAVILSPEPIILNNNEVSIIGTVENSVKGQKGLRAIVAVDRIDDKECKPLRIRLSVSDQTKSLREGDIIRVKGILEPGDRLADIPFMDISSQVNKSDRVSATMFVRPEYINIIGSDNSLWYRISHLRTAIAEVCYSSGLSPEASSLLVGACLGTGDTNIEVKDRFRATGLAHLLCVSGFHVGIVAWLISLILWPVKVWSQIGRIRYVIILAGVWFFVLITGAQPSAIRAATMISSFYMGSLLQRKASPYNSLALAVGIMIAFNPYNLYSIGFQLSVSAVLALLVFADKLNYFSISQNKPYRIVSIVTVPLAAMIGTAPAVLYWFHRLPLLSVPVNAIATIIFPFFLASSCLAVIFDWQWTVYIADSLCNAILKICDLAIYFDTDILSGIYLNPSRLSLIVAIIILCGLALHLTKTRLCYGAGAMAVAATILLLIPSTDTKVELIATGNSIGNQIIVRNSNKCFIISTKNKMPIDMTDYFNGHGVTTDQIITVGEEALMIDDVSIGFIGSQKGTLSAVDILLIDGKCKDDISAILKAYKSHIVLIGANTPEARCREIESVGRQRGIISYRLFDKAFKVGRSELKALKELAHD